MRLEKQGLKIRPGCGWAWQPYSLSHGNFAILQRIGFVALGRGGWAAFLGGMTVRPACHWQSAASQIPNLFLLHPAACLPQFEQVAFVSAEGNRL